MPGLGFRVGVRAGLGNWGSGVERNGGVGGVIEAEGVRSSQRCRDSKFEIWGAGSRAALGNGRWGWRARDRTAEIEPAGVIQRLLSGKWCVSRVNTIVFFFHSAVGHFHIWECWWVQM